METRPVLAATERSKIAASNTTSIALSLTEDYAPTWGCWEGVRELVQNWHDGCLCGGEARAQFEEWQAGGLVRRYEGVVGGVSVGSAIYDAERQELTLVNRNVALARRVLLLGSSKKAAVSESIGQFGEGLKVGALALLRDGRSVAMSTRDEHWAFVRKLDPAFGVRVLTVEISARDVHAAEVAGMKSAPSAQVELGEADTCTVVGPISPAEWAAFARRFLFLSPAAESFRCELGELLLDDSLGGQLYVKGVWIASLREEGLGSGVDLRHLRLDRDRRAVVHTSDLESQAAAMWVRAIDARPQLAARVFTLMQAASPASDVRRVAEFLSLADRPTAAGALAGEFYRLMGDGAVPISHSGLDGGDVTALGCSLSELERRLRRRIVLVSPTLLDVLRSCGVSPLDELAAALGGVAEAIVPPAAVAWEQLGPDERRTARRAARLAQLAGDASFDVALLDIIDASRPRRAPEAAPLARVEVPQSALRQPVRHICGGLLDIRAHDPRACGAKDEPSSIVGGACACAEVLLFRAIVDARLPYLKQAQQQAQGQGQPLVDLSLPVAGCDALGTELLASRALAALVHEAGA